MSENNQNLTTQNLKNSDSKGETIKWELLRGQIANCKKCRLCEKRIQAVPGSGNLKTEIMFIGEGPGKNEDEQGLPFVGAAGKFLDQMLASIELTRNEVFITNVVKCRPPENRDPLPDEVTACWSYLMEQIKIIQPLLIVTLGRHAMYRFLPETFKISDIHGQAKKMLDSKTGASQTYFPIYHPAAALYNPNLRDTLISDFKKIPKVLEILRKK